MDREDRSQMHWAGPPERLGLVWGKKPERDERDEKRALELQAQGPDEYPFGYYLFLAQVERMREEDAS